MTDSKAAHDELDLEMQEVLKDAAVDETTHENLHGECIVEGEELGSEGETAEDAFETNVTDEKTESKEGEETEDELVKQEAELNQIKELQESEDSRDYQEENELVRIKEAITKEKLDEKVIELTDKVNKRVEDVTEKVEEVKKVVEQKEYEAVHKDGLFAKLNSIRVKLVVSFLIPVIFIVILGVTSYQNASKALTESYEESTFKSIETASNYFGLAAKAIELRLTQLKGYDSLKTYYSSINKDNAAEDMVIYKQLSDYIITTAYSDNLITNLGVFSKYGNPLCSYGKFAVTGQELTQAYSETEEGQKVDAEKGGYVWSGRHDFYDANLKEDASKPLKDYAFAVSTGYFGNGIKQIGYITADLNRDMVTEQLATLEVGDDSIFAVVSADGYEVTNRALDHVVFADKEFYQEAITSENEAGHTYVTYEGKKHLFLYSKIGTTGLVVCGLVPNNYLTSQATSILMSTIILVAIAVITAIAISTFIATGMDRTIKRMIAAMQQAAKGDLTVSVKCRRKDELRILSDTANQMIRNMKDLIQKASLVKDTMNESTKEVTQSSETMRIAAGNISNSIEEIRIGIVSQAEDSEKCLRQGDELSSQVMDMSNSIDAISELAQHSKGAVAEGLSSMEVLNEKSKQTSDVTKTIINDMQLLEEESRSIGTIIGVINDIASQTNLLSLNASIEAARAGSAGRGFAVVADEIRKLADQSVKASAEIGSIIRNIQDKTAHTVKSVRTSEEIVQSQTQALEVTMQLFDNINTSVDNISIKLEDISEGIENIKESERTTVGAIESISAVSEETAAASEEVDAAAGRQVDEVEKLREATIQLSEQAEELDRALNIFKI